jgi:thiol-disulfide isomerase/thioredoxin
MRMQPKLKAFVRNHGVTLILLALITYIWFRPPASVTEERREISPWSVRLTDGRLLTSEELKGKVVLVNLWATWCPYCLKEMPVIEEFWKDNRENGFEVVAISVDDSPEQVMQYMKDKGYQFKASANDPSAIAAFGRPASIPTSFVLDKMGIIRYEIAGQVHYPRLEKLFNSLL